MNSGTHLYPESSTLITEIEATGVGPLQLKPETKLFFGTQFHIQTPERH